MTGRGKASPKCPSTAKKIDGKARTKCSATVKTQTEETSMSKKPKAPDLTPARTSSCQTPAKAKNPKGARGASSPVESVIVQNPSPQKGKGARRKSPDQKQPTGTLPRNESNPPQERQSFRRGGSTEEEPGRVLLRILNQLKIKREARSEASKIKNEVVEKIKTHLEKSSNFKRIKILPTGSYFENLKIGNPDEFDVMFTIPARIDVQPFGSDGAYYSVKFKRSPNHDLKEFISDDGNLSASDMLKAFRREVKASTKTIPSLKMEPKKLRSPAVTLFLKVDDSEISIDIVLGLEVEGSWPSCAQEGMAIDTWLGTKVIKHYKSKPYYLVPKHDRRANETDCGVRAEEVWRISFSHVEKGIMKNHGSEKTCCEVKGAKCCRKQCLKLLKHLLAELKDKHPKELSKFYSYHAKTTLLHACTERTSDGEWRLSDLHNCFQLLLQDFVRHLRRKTLPNFFIPGHNLLGSVGVKTCNDLAHLIEYERNNGFPIFTNSGTLIQLLSKLRI